MHSLTRIGDICIAPTHEPDFALGLPPLSTAVMASITLFQSKLLLLPFVTAFAVREAKHINNKKTKTLNILIINNFMEPEPILGEGSRHGLM